MAEQVVTELIVDASSAQEGSAAYIRAMRQAQAARDQLTQAEEKAQIAESKQSAVILGLTGSISRTRQEWQRLYEGINPVVRAERELEQAMLRTDTALRRGIATQQKANEVLSVYRKRLQDARAAAAAEASASAGGRRGLAAYEVQQIALQAPDIIQGALTGGGIRSVLQQGGQIVQGLGMGEGGFAGGLSRLTTSLGSVLTIGRVAFAGIAGGVALAGVELLKYQTQQDRLTDSLQLLGRQSGLTTEGLNRVALAGAAVGGLSNREGRNAASQFASAGLQGSLIQNLIGDTKSFARATGTGLDEAGDNLAKMFAKPAEGAKKLQEQFGGLDAAGLELIDTLDKTGQTAAAQDALFARLDQRLKQVKDTTWTVHTVWDALTNSISNAGDAAAAAAQRTLAPTLEQRLQSANAAANAPLMPFFPGGGNETAKQEAEDLNEQFRRQNQLAAQRARDDVAGSSSIDAAGIIKGIVPELSKFQDLQATIDKLKLGLSQNGGLGSAADYSKEALARLEGAAHSLTDENGKLLTNSDLAAEKFKIEALAISARTLAEKEAVAQMKAEADARGQQISVLDQYIEKMRAASLVAKQAQRDSEDALRAARDNAALAGLPSFQRSQLELEQRFRDQREKLGDNSTLRQAEAFERQALAQSSIIGPMREANEGINAQIRLLTAQRDTFGQMTEAVAAAAEKQRLINQFSAEGITINESLMKSIDAEAERYGKLQQAAEDLAKVQERVKQQVGDIEGAFGDMLTTVEDDIIGGKGKNIGRDLLKLFSSTALKSANRQLEDMFKDAFEKPLTSWFSKAMGADKIALPALTDTKVTPLMNVTASVVNLSGGGLPGLGAANNNTGLGIGPVGNVTSSPLAAPQYGQAGPYMNGGGPGNAFGAAAGIAAAAGNFRAPAAGASGYGLTNAPYLASLTSKSRYGFTGPQEMYNYLISNGASRNEALMLSGAAANESSFDQNAVHDQGSGFGLFGHNLGRLNLRGQDWQQQSVAALAELRRRPESAMVNAAQSPEDLARAQMFFEAPRGFTSANPMGGDNYTGRVNTLRYFSQMGGPQQPANPLAQVPGALDTLTQSTDKLKTAATTTAPALGDVSKGTIDLSNSLSSLGGIIGGKSGAPGGSLLGSGLGSILGMLLKPFGFADGTDSAPGGVAWVGERGPELMNVPRGAQIIPNHILRARATNDNRGAGGRAVVNHTFSPSFTVDARGAQVGAAHEIRQAMSDMLQQYDAHLDRTLPQRVGAARARYA